LKNLDGKKKDRDLNKEKLIEQNNSWKKRFNRKMRNYLLQPSVPIFISNQEFLAFDEVSKSWA